MTTTTNYGLNLPEDSDYADIAKINENFQKLDDSALKAAAVKDAPADADGVVLVDSADKSSTKRVLWSVIKGLFAAASHTHKKSEISDFPSSLAPTAHAGTHATSGTDPLTPAQIGAATTTTLTATVPVSWTASGSYYYQQVSVAGMLEADNPVADILPGSDNAANKLYAEAWGKVQSIDTLDGAVKIWCTAAPTTAFPVVFKVVRG